MAMKGYSAFPEAPALLELHHQIFLWLIQDTRWRSLTPMQRCSRCILHPQPNGTLDNRWRSLTPMQRCSRCILHPQPNGTLDNRWRSLSPVQRCSRWAKKCKEIIPTEWTWEWWQCRGTLHFSKFQHSRNLTIRLFSVTSGHSLRWGGLTPQQSIQRILRSQLTGQVTVACVYKFLINLLNLSVRSIFKLNWINVFPSPKVVDLPKLENPIKPSIYPWLWGKKKNLFFSQG